MIAVKVSSPRFRKATEMNVGKQDLVGPCADRAAAAHGYGAGLHTFALDGQILNRDEILSRVVEHKSRVELVIR